MNEIELLRLAKELTGSCDIKELMSYSLELKNFIIPPENKKFLPEKLKIAYMNPLLGEIVSQSTYNYETLDEDFYSDNYKILTTITRQKGVSTYIAYKAIQEAISNDDISVVLISYNRTTTNDLMEKVSHILDYHENAPALPNIITCNKKQVTFENGSKIFGRVCSSDAIRGLDPDVILIDNCTYISYSVLNDFLKSAFPLLSTKKSKILGFSTGCEKTEVCNMETY